MEIKVHKISNLVGLFMAVAIIGSTIAMFLITSGMQKENREMLKEVERIYQTYEAKVK